MKRTGLLILILLLCFAASSLSQNRIMLVGNSITHGLGSTDGFGFRKTLYDSLQSVSYPFINVVELGLDKVLINAVGLFGVFVAVTAALTLLNRLLGRAAGAAASS